MHFSAFLSSLRIMGQGLLAIFAVMICIWLMIVLIKHVFR